MNGLDCATDPDALWWCTTHRQNLIVCSNNRNIQVSELQKEVARQHGEPFTCGHEPKYAGAACAVCHVIWIERATVAERLNQELQKVLEAAKEHVCHVAPWFRLQRCKVCMAVAAYEKLLSEKPVCEHDWKDARNKVVTSGELCIKCFAIRAGNATTDLKRNDEVGSAKGSEAMASDWVICGWCAGTGKEERSRQTCPKCNGAGGGKLG